MVTVRSLGAFGDEAEVHFEVGGLFGSWDGFDGEVAEGCVACLAFRGVMAALAEELQADFSIRGRFEGLRERFPLAAFRG